MSLMLHSHLIFFHPLVARFFIGNSLNWKLFRPKFYTSSWADEHLIIFQWIFKDSTLYNFLFLQLLNPKLIRLNHHPLSKRIFYFWTNVQENSQESYEILFIFFPLKIEFMSKKINSLHWYFEWRHLHDNIRTKYKKFWSID